MNKKSGGSERKHSFKKSKRGAVRNDKTSDKKSFDKTDKKSFNKKDTKPFDRKDKKPFDRKDKKSFDRKDKKSFDRSEDRKPPRKIEVRSVFEKRKLEKKTDKRVQFIDGADLNYRTKLDKAGFQNKNEAREPTMQELDNTEIRLNKYIAEAGVCSRREADELITQGLIMVNGKEVNELGTKVKPTDRVKHENKLLVIEQKVYILLNKPKGFITTTNDPEDRATVLDIVADSTPYRVYPVGRLDRNTTGVLMLTNDGDFMEKVTHPKFNITKIYKVGLDRRIETSELQKLLDGVLLEDGVARADNIAFLDDSKMVVGIEIHSGKNRIIRRMFEHLNADVKSLDRTSFGPFTKTNLRPGQFRNLNDKEMNLVGRLKKSKNKTPKAVKVERKPRPRK